MHPNIILDTTYILPLFGYEIDLPKRQIEVLKSIWKSGVQNYEIFIPSLALLEVIYKLNGDFRNQESNLIFSYYVDTLPTILDLQHVHIIYCETNTIATEMAFKIRQLGHKDLMDCYIAASAYALDGVYLTEEKTIQNILKLIPEYHIERIWNMNRLEKELNLDI